VGRLHKSDFCAAISFKIFSYRDTKKFIIVIFLYEKERRKIKIGGRKEMKSERKKEKWLKRGKQNDQRDICLAHVTHSIAPFKVVLYYSLWVTVRTVLLLVLPQKVSYHLKRACSIEAHLFSHTQAM
jgi:hypothetical protein